MKGVTLAALLATYAAAASCAGGSPAADTPDTPANRRQAAEQYLAAVPPGDLLRDMTEHVSQTMPPSRRPAFLRAMTHVDTTAIANAMLSSLVNRFTVREIHALTQFYGSREGKSIIKKLGLYTADVMPVLQAEMTKAAAGLADSTK